MCSKIKIVLLYYRDKHHCFLAYMVMKLEGKDISTCFLQYIKNSDNILLTIDEL